MAATADAAAEGRPPLKGPPMRRAFRMTTTTYPGPRADGTQGPAASIARPFLGAISALVAVVAAKSE
jgi:hypothetical protein